MANNGKEGTEVEANEEVREYYRVYEIKVDENKNIYKQPITIIAATTASGPYLEKVKLVDDEWVEV